MSEQHVIRVEARSNGKWRAVCQDGDYISDPCTQAEARHRGNLHVAAKTGTAFGRRR